MDRFPTSPWTTANPDAATQGLLSRAWGKAGSLTVLGLCMAWSFWPTLVNMADRWSHDPQYSHGFLVPLFAAVILWHRRECLPVAAAANWWGLGLMGLGIALRLTGAWLYFEALDAFALLPVLGGMCLLLGGWAALQWAWPAIAFLAFMLPLPFQVEMALAGPLRRLATVASTYCLQTMGLPALSEGNIIHIDEVKLGVIDACGGLGMLMTFFALSTAVAIVMQRRLADKLVIVASAVPIALIANVARITATGVVHSEYGAAAGHVLHDWAGWLMMPLALVLLWLELQFLSRLLVDVQHTAPLPLPLALPTNQLPAGDKRPAVPPAQTAPIPRPVSTRTGDPRP